MIYNLDDLLRHQTEGRSARTALVDGDRKISYSELLRLTGQHAGLLLDIGIRRFDRVAIFLPRSVEHVAVLFAVWRIGAVAVIINDVLKNRQVQYILDHAQVTALVTDRHLASGLTSAENGTLKIVRIDESELPESPHDPGVRPIGSDLALIIYTSGSTGMPKGIMLSHNNVLSGAFIVSDYLKLTQDDTIISLLPFSFDYGLNQLTTALYVGGCLVIQRSVLPADICNTLVREKVTGMGCVPMLWQQLASERSPFVKNQFPYLRYITNTGGRMPESITRMFRRVHPRVQIFLMFGLTEAFRSTFLPPEQVDVRPTSIGKAIPNVEILVLNERGEECGPGEVGELVHRGANIAMGYWRDGRATAERFRPAPFQQGKEGIPETAVFSGDYVKRDEEGFLYYIGRRDQMMKSHGMRVSPEEIEDCLYASNILAHVVVFAVSQGDGESTIVAAVVPSDSAGFHTDQIMRFSRKEMPEYLRPSVFWTLKGFPQTSSGKPDRVKIREMYVESLKH